MLFRSEALSERSLKLSELQTFSSVQEAIAYLATQEAEAVQRGSFDDKLKHFGKQLSIDLKPLASYRDEISEIALRRNLLTHNQGIVNKTYLTQAPRNYIKREGLRLGQRLEVTESYLSGAVDLIYLYGFILLQQCWRKWEKQNSLQADYTLFYKGIYQALVDERYEVASELSKYAEGLKSVNEGVMHGIIVNHAIALRELDERSAMLKLLRKHNIEAWGQRYQIASHALRGEYEALFRLLPKAIDAGEVQHANLEHWPLFKPVRTDPRFILLLDKGANP